MKEAILYQNGKEVGNFECTNDESINKERAFKLLENKGILNNSTKFEKIYHQAIKFEKSTQVIYKECTNSNELIVPLLVNASFCVELMLKSLHVYNDKKFHGHSLLKLYKSLSSEYQIEIENLFNQYSGLNQKSFCEILNNLENTFVDWRYLHEKEETSIIKSETILIIIKVLKELLLSKVEFKN